MSLKQQQLDDAADLILNWCKPSIHKDIDYLIIEIADILFPSIMGSYLGPTDKSKDLLLRFERRGHALEETIKGIYQEIKTHYGTVIFQTPKNNLGTAASKFTRRQQDALSVGGVTSKEDLNYVLETVIDDFCIHQVEVTQQPGPSYRYYAEFTDKKKGVILFKLLLTSNRIPRSPEEIILATLKSYYDEYKFASSILRYDSENGKIVQR